MNITPNFKREEFNCKDGTPYPEAFLPDLQKLCNVLEVIRSQLASPITITSGYRSPAHNALVGGASYSQHCLGRAADIQSPGHDPHDVHDLILKLYQDGKILIGGLGRYDGWTHVDVRPQNPAGHLARWEGAHE